MQPDYSISALYQFLDFVRDKGLASRSTAQGWQVAAGKLLSNLDEAEASDVREIDLDHAVRRFNNKNPGLLSPKSLGEYRRRVAQAIGEFLAWVDDPTGYRPKGATPMRRKDEQSAKKPAKARPHRADSVERAPTATPAALALHVASAQGLSLQFPLRPDFLAHVVVPRDLKTDEARRLGAFILTLAHDYAPAS